MQDLDRIIECFAARLREVYPDARVWAFGSRARGDASPDSDFDVCVVMPRVADQDRRHVRHIAWEIAFENETVFNTLVFSAKEFETGPMSESTLVSNILREGIAA